MPSLRTTLASPLSALGALGLVAALSSPAKAALLDEPPRVLSFKLDDPATSRLTLLEAFHDAAIERSSGSRRYLSGSFGRWWAQPWRTLSWLPASTSDAAPRAAAAPVESDLLGGTAYRLGSAEVGAGERLFGFEAPAPGGRLEALTLAAEPPAWLGRLDPTTQAPRFASTGTRFASNGFDALWSLPEAKPIPNWRCRRRPVRVVRFSGESDTFPLVRCDGSVAPEALDRLTLMARVPEVARPGELLPDEPDPEAIPRGEWLPGVRLVHPRLLWALQRVADAFPWRTVYIFSGYRPGATVTSARSGTHHSMHSAARALDINVMGIPNATLFAFCRSLEDVGCGFYPNSKFVHVDIRRPGTGRAFWIDVSGPGEPSRYVDAWPGVVDGGALAWDPAGKAGPAGAPSAEASCTQR